MSSDLPQKEIIEFVSRYMDHYLFIKHFSPDELAHLPCTSEPGSFSGSFTFEGIPFFSKVAKCGEEHFFHLKAPLGYIPYSYESFTNRAHVLAALFTYERMNATYLRCDDKSILWFDMHVALAHPVTPSHFLVLLISHLMAYQPFLRLLRPLLGGEGTLQEEKISAPLVF